MESVDDLNPLPAAIRKLHKDPAGRKKMGEEPMGSNPLNTNFGTVSLTFDKILAE